MQSGQVPSSELGQVAPTVAVFIAVGVIEPVGFFPPVEHAVLVVVGEPDAGLGDLPRPAAKTAVAAEAHEIVPRAVEGDPVRARGILRVGIEWPVAEVVEGDDLGRGPLAEGDEGIRATPNRACNGLGTSLVLALEQDGAAVERVCLGAVLGNAEAGQAEDLGLADRLQWLVAGVVVLVGVIRPFAELELAAFDIGEDPGVEPAAERALGQPVVGVGGDALRARSRRRRDRGYRPRP